MKRALLVVALLIAGPAIPRGLTAQRPAEGQVTVEFIDVGQGDSVLIRSPEGKTALIDAGPSTSVVASLKAMGVTSIDLVVVTHHHSDHYGGMIEVVKQFHPKYFLTTGSSHTTPMYLKLLKLVQQENIQAIQALPKPRRIELGSVVLTIFPQPPMNHDEENDNSIGIRVSMGNFSAVLTGDSEEAERDYWMAHNPELLRDATILKLAHHGSRNGTDARWLDLIRPELTVASLGAGNTYGHPHAETIALLRRKQIPLNRTDRDGSIKVVSDGRQWDLEAEESPGRTAEGPASKKARTR